ncbi:MAG: hypothetical protein WCT14_03365 [Treponemataceae bacterium]
MISSSRFFLFLTLILTVSLTSCIGISSDVEVRADGSGTIALEYRISRLVESMGKLKGEERWLPLPLFRADMETTISRVEGLSLNSFTAKEDETDITVKAGLSFSDVGVLSRFLNSTGRQATLAEEGGKRSLTLRLAEGGGPLDSNLKRLVDTLFAGYVVSLRFKFPSIPVVQGGGSVDAATRSAVFSSPVAQILSTEKPLAWIITW